MTSGQWRDPGKSDSGAALIDWITLAVCAVVIIALLAYGLR